MAKEHKELLLKQFEILDDLKSGKNYIDVARSAREFLKSVYGEGIPSGADLAINTNSICNLECAHCYYGSTHTGKGERLENLNARDWKRFVNECAKLGFSRISIIGKEPLLSPIETEAVIRSANKKELDLQIITNGTLIEENINWLKKYNYSFFYVSLDGCEEKHDSIRGKGSYNKTINGLDIAKKSGIENIAVIFTAMQDNLEDLENVIKIISDIGVEYLNIGFCFLTPHNNENVVSDFSKLCKALDIVKNIEHNLDITFNLVAEDHGEIISELYRRGFFDSDLAVTENFGPAIIKILNRSPRVVVKINVFPLEYYAGMRVDCDGKVMNFCTDLRGCKRKWFGDIKKESLKDIYWKAREKWEVSSEDALLKLQRQLIGNE